MTDEQEVINRWRLLLGKYASDNLPFSESAGSFQYMDMEQVLDFIYSKEYGEEQEVREMRGGGMEDSNITVPRWITKVKTLFPKKTVEIMEKHALQRYNMTELLTDPEILNRLEPNKELCKTILQLKHMMKGPVLDVARRIVKQVADELTKKLEQELRQSFFGKLNRNASTPIKSARNLDMKKTVRMNLKHYDISQRQMVLQNVYFNARQKKYNTWRVIVCVDESGSMMDSVIHSAVMAGIFAKLPMLDTKIVIFDTNVVDLSGYVDDPVEVLMSVRLGGGTNISGALGYCESLIENPHRTILVLVSDLFDGGGYTNMLHVTKNIVESGAKMIVLTALDMEANPNYDRKAAAQMADVGAYVGALTPEELAGRIGDMIA